MMVKAAALYIVVIISLMIAIISASLLSVAFYYRLGNQKKVRLDKLLYNLESGTAILLSKDYKIAETDSLKDLYGDQQDSVILSKTYWGAYYLNTVKTMTVSDTLKRAFLSGIATTDSSAIYLADEDRPLSLSGTTKITGNGEIPKSGVKASYVEGKGYAGEKLIFGKTKNSARDLPALAEEWISHSTHHFDAKNGHILSTKDFIINSFFNPPLIYKLTADQDHLSDLKLNGKIILVSDTTLTIGSNMSLKDVLIFAPAILIKDGFVGSCQLFARDSIIIGKKCIFQYPSFAGVFKPEGSKTQAKVSVGEGSQFSGLLFSYEKKRSDFQTIINLGKGTMIKGEVFATGYIKLDSALTIHGKVYAKRFLTQKGTSMYENYLIDLELNRRLLSKYYLSGALFKVENVDHQILKWLN